MMLKLKDLYLFEGVSEEFIYYIIDNARRVEYISGDSVIHEGEDSDGNAYIIQDGKAKVEREGEKVANLKASDIFGEIALITNEPRTASVIAETDLVLYKINKELLHKMIKEFKNGKEIQAKIMERITQNHKK